MLKYYFGTMASGKSATLLMNAYQKKTSGSKNKEVLILKPFEKRDGDKVTSRVGLESDCIVFYPEDDVAKIIYQEIKKKENSLEIFIDECQFLTKEQIHQLWSISRGINNVNCFGLKNTYKNELFNGIIHLMAYADEIIKLEPTCTCKYCDEIATTHLLIAEDKPVLDFPEKVEGDIEGDIHFECVCIGCWLDKIEQE